MSAMQFEVVISADAEVTPAKPAPDSPTDTNQE